jgi:hypothetical protein
MAADVPNNLPVPATAGWTYLASLVGMLAEPGQRWCVRHAAPAPVGMPRPDGLDTDAAWLLATAASCQALRPPEGLEQRRLDSDLAQVCAAIDLSELQERDIELTVACQPVILSGWRSWQICWIVAELLLDAARHSHSVRSITVEFAAADEAQFAVVDDGVASPDPAWRRARLEVDGLVVEMGGRIARCREETGSAVVVSMSGATLQLRRHSCHA